MSLMMSLWPRGGWVCFKALFMTWKRTGETPGEEVRGRPRPPTSNHRHTRTNLSRKTTVVQKNFRETSVSRERSCRSFRSIIDKREKTTEEQTSKKLWSKVKQHKEFELKVTDSASHLFGFTWWRGQRSERWTTRSGCDAAFVPDRWVTL